MTEEEYMLLQELQQRSQRTRQPAPQPQPQPKANQPHHKTAQRTAKGDSYERGGLAAAHLTAITLYALAWLLNGVTTVAPFALLFAQFHAIGIGVGIGIVLHIAISLIEHHLWRSGDRSTYFLIVGVGAFDVLTTALSFILIGVLLHMVSAITPQVLVICTALAELVAIIPEPMIVRHIRLYRASK